MPGSSAAAVWVPDRSGWPAALSRAWLNVVTGKGGTGKTTVAAALALALATDGRRALLNRHMQLERRGSDHAGPLAAPNTAAQRQVRHSGTPQAPPCTTKTWLSPARAASRSRSSRSHTSCRPRSSPTARCRREDRCLPDSDSMLSSRSRAMTTVRRQPVDHIGKAFRLSAPASARQSRHFDLPTFQNSTYWTSERHRRTHRTNTTP